MARAVNGLPQHIRFSSCDFDLAALDRGYKRLVISFSLVGVRDGKISQRFPNLYTCTAISANLARVPGPGMTPRQQLTGYDRQAIQAATAQHPQIDAALVIVELPDQVLMGPDARPAQQQVR